MWFRRLYRRRREPPTLLLPSLDRLADVVERVVALLDQLTLAPEAPAREEIVVQEHKVEPAADGWVAFIPSPERYRLLEREGRPPERGAVIELEGGVFAVLRLGPSPFPGDRRRCAFVEQEPPAGKRSFDA